MPLDRGVLDQHLHALGETERWWNKRELRDLPAALHADEELFALAHGKVARLRWLRRKWLIVVTDKRLVCLRSNTHTGWRQFEVPGSQITRVALRIGPFRGRVVLSAGGNTYRLLVPKADAFKLSSALSDIAPARTDRLAGGGPTRVVRRVIDHVLALPAAAFNPYPPEPKPLPPPRPALDPQVDALERQVAELKEQVEFLQELLRQRQSEVGSR